MDSVHFGCIKFYFPWFKRNLTLLELKPFPWLQGLFLLVALLIRDNFVET